MGCGRMDASLLANGKMGSSMVWASFGQLRATNVQASGEKAFAYVGWTRARMLHLNATYVLRESADLRCSQVCAPRERVPALQSSIFLNCMVTICCIRCRFLSGRAIHV